MLREPSADAPTRHLEQHSNGPDQALVREVLLGSENAWHEFIERYSRLILAVLRRYLGRHDDTVRSVYADLLENLYRRKLATYQGRSALSTWLVLVTRNAAIDHLRGTLGGRELRKALAGLDAFDRRVFQLYYVQGLSFGTTLELLRVEGPSTTHDRLLEALQSIETRVNGRTARTLRYEIHAQSVGQASGRLLEYLDHVRVELGGMNQEQNVEYRLMEREARRVVDQAMALLATLPEAERRVLSLRFERGWTARRIAEELGIGDQRRVYTMIQRILRGLRQILTMRSTDASRRGGRGVRDLTSIAALSESEEG